LSINTYTQVVEKISSKKITIHAFLYKTIENTCVRVRTLLRFTELIKGNPTLMAMKLLLFSQKNLFSLAAEPPFLRQKDLAFSQKVTPLPHAKKRPTPGERKQTLV
jgi:hypothetical protein